MPVSFSQSALSLSPPTSAAENQHELSRIAVKLNPEYTSAGNSDAIGRKAVRPFLMLYVFIRQAFVLAEKRQVFHLPNS
jgi:hypothetical protein